MNLIILTITLIFQEAATTGAALLGAQSEHLNPWIVHLIWLATTIIDIAIGFAAGKWVQRRFVDSKLDHWTKKWAVKAEGAIGKTGTKIAILLIAFITYPYLIAFVASWLPTIKLRDIFFYTILGNAVWYTFEWGTILGITAAGHNYELIFAIIAAAGITLILIGNFIKRKMLQ